LTPLLRSALSGHPFASATSRTLAESPPRAKSGTPVVISSPGMLRAAMGTCLAIPRSVGRLREPRNTTGVRSALALSPQQGSQPGTELSPAACPVRGQLLPSGAPRRPTRWANVAP
jgi:hypothetical protein